MQTEARDIARSAAAIVAADVRALVSLIVGLLALPLILMSGAEVLRGP